MLHVPTRGTYGDKAKPLAARSTDGFAV